MAVTKAQRRLLEYYARTDPRSNGGALMAKLPPSWARSNLVGRLCTLGYLEHPEGRSGNYLIITGAGLQAIGKESNALLVCGEG